jgi:dienelactone hydrolase
MLHGCAGVFNADGNISSIYREWADRLMANGTTALLVDSFTPRSAGNQCNNGAGVGVSEVFDRPQDAVAGAAYLASGAVGVNAARIGVMGWSHGASTVMGTLATKDPVSYNSTNPQAAGTPFRVGVAFYAGGGLSDSRCGTTSDGKLKGCWKSLTDSRWDTYAPLYFHHGDADTTTTLAKVVSRVSQAQSLPGGASLNLTTYPGAEHSFDDAGVGGGACDTANAANTPNACAKQAADAAALTALLSNLN